AAAPLDSSSAVLNNLNSGKTGILFKDGPVKPDTSPAKAPLEALMHAPALLFWRRPCSAVLGLPISKIAFSRLVIPPANPAAPCRPKGSTNWRGLLST